MNKGSISMPFFQWVKSQIRYKVSIDSIRTPFGEPFNSDNHWYKTLNEYENGVNNYKDTSLYKFHQNFTPNSIQDVYLPNGNKESNQKNSKKISSFNLGEYPWGKWTSREGRDAWMKSVHCGPSSDELIKSEWNRFIGLYKKIKKEGLNFKKYGHPMGIFFKKDGESFFIVLGGNHRIAIASYLKIDYVFVRMLPRDYIESQVVKYSSLEYCKPSAKLFSKIISKDFYKWTD